MAQSDLASDGTRRLATGDMSALEISLSPDDGDDTEGLCLGTGGVPRGGDTGSTGGAGIASPSGKSSLKTVYFSAMDPCRVRPFGWGEVGAMGCLQVERER